MNLFQLYIYIYGLLKLSMEVLLATCVECKNKLNNNYNKIINFNCF